MTAIQRYEVSLQRAHELSKAMLSVLEQEDLSVAVAAVALTLARLTGPDGYDVKPEDAGMFISSVTDWIVAYWGGGGLPS